MAATCELIQLLGKTNLIRLQAALGPRNLYIPTEAKIGHPICNAIGRAAMISLCHDHGGTTVWIGNGYSNQERNAEISRMQSAGVDGETIAQAFGISRRYVRDLAREAHIRPLGLRERRQVRQGIQGMETLQHGKGYRRDTGRDGTPNRQARRMAASR